MKKLLPCINAFVHTGFCAVSTALDGGAVTFKHEYGQDASKGTAAALLDARIDVRDAAEPEPRRRCARPMLASVAVCAPVRHPMGAPRASGDSWSKVMMQSLCSDCCLALQVRGPVDLENE